MVLLSLDFRKQSRSLDDEMTFCITKEKQNILVPLGLPSCDSGFVGARWSLADAVCMAYLMLRLLAW